MTKKSSPRNREWEKDRRDRLNKTFDSLAKKLPQYDPSSPFSKIEILQKTIAFIEELQEKQNELLLSECDKVVLKEREEFEQSITVLRCRNSQLAELLRQANITIPSFKGQKFAKDLSEKRIESLLEENNANGINVKPEKQKKYSNKLSSDQISKAVQDNDEKTTEKGGKKSSRGKTSPPKSEKKASKSKKTKEKAIELKPPLSTIASVAVSAVASTTIVSGSEGKKTSVISAISSSKNVTITHSSLTTPIMATGLFLPVPVVQAPAPRLLIVNTMQNTPAKKRGKGKWIQIRPQPIPPRIPFGKIPIPALRSNFIAKKKKRLVRRRIRVKGKEMVSEGKKVTEKRKAEEKMDEVEEKKSKPDAVKESEKENRTNRVEEKTEEETKKTEKAIGEMIPDPPEISAPLSHSDLSNDIFASLQVPSGGSNTGCLSPTAAFLMTFPVVSSAGGKNPETALAEESPNNSANVVNQAEGGKEDQEVENSSALLENLSSLFGGRDDYPGLYQSENLEKTPQKLPEKTSTEAVGNSIRIRTDMGVNQQKPMENQIPTSFSDSFSTFDYSFSNTSTSKINSSVFPSYTSMPFLPDVPPPSSVNPTKTEFTFSLTKTTTTAPCSSYKADSLYNPFSFATTSTHSSIINSSCHPVPPETNLGLPLPLNIYPNVSEDTSKGQGSFTFSLTNTTSAQSYYTKTSTNLNISFPSNDTYNTYNPFSYNDPVGIKQPNDMSTNFSFCLTSSSSKNAPIYTSTSTYNTLNPFSIDATLQTSNYRQQNYENPKNYQFYPSQKQAHKSQSKGYQKETPRAQNTQQKSPPKKNQTQQSKYHNVNWMTNSDCQVKTNDFHIPPPLDFTHTTNASSSFTYPPPPPPALGGNIDLKSKSDVFFAHPPDENFSWSPNKLSNVLEPPTLHNYMPQATLPTLHGDLALSTTSVTHESVKEKLPPQNLENYHDHNQTGGNFLSVSQLLVEQNKKGKKSKNTKNTDDASRKPLKDKKQFQCMNPSGSYTEQGLPYNNTDNTKGTPQQYSNIYSAENLIGCSRKDKGVQQNYHQAPPLELPPGPAGPSGGNLFPNIDLNSDYNTNLLFNPPTSSTFVPPPQNCMSVFPENDFYDYSNKATTMPKVAQQQNTYYFNKTHQNTPMEVKSSATYGGNKLNVQSAKSKKTAKIPDFYPPPPPQIHSNINYDSSVSSSNYFSVPLGVNSPHLQPGEDPFHLHLNYSSTLKNLAPGNASSALYLPEGPNVSNTTNSHTNFHLSSICPEINDKVRQQDW